MRQSDSMTFGPTRDSIYEFNSNNTGREGWDFSNSYEDRLQKIIADRIKGVSEVEYIFCQREEDIFLVWTVINKLDVEARRRIYRKQREIIDLFKDETFDFYVVAREGQAPESIINQDGVELIYPRRES